MTNKGHFCRANENFRQHTLPHTSVLKLTDRRKIVGVEFAPLGEASQDTSALQCPCVGTLRNFVSLLKYVPPM